MVVLIAGRGVVRWNANGVRRAHSFRSSKAARQSFRQAVDRAAATARSTAPNDVSLKLVEAFPTAEIRAHDSLGARIRHLSDDKSEPATVVNRS
ncbi:MAG: hypothetical protein H0V73_01590 [Chloroflexi bacterium]|nr:hypothetical protein [Chloroflexota bacterium]